MPLCFVLHVIYLGMDVRELLSFAGNVYHTDIRFYQEFLCMHWNHGLVNGFSVYLVPFSFLKGLVSFVICLSDLLHQTWTLETLACWPSGANCAVSSSLLSVNESYRPEFIELRKWLKERKFEDTGLVPACFPGESHGEDGVCHFQKHVCCCILGFLCRHWCVLYSTVQREVVHGKKWQWEEK